MARTLRWVVAIALCIVLVLCARTGVALGAWDSPMLVARQGSWSAQPAASVHRAGAGSVYAVASE